MRKEGWYWVKLEGSNRWIPWQWIDESSLLKARWYNAEQPIEVGPRIPAPDEPWQCVPLEATPDMCDVLTVGHARMAINKWRDALAISPQPDDE